MFGIVADDFTGACDSGVQFSKKGLRTIVALDYIDEPKCDVLVVNSASRALPFNEAYEQARKACKLLKSMGAKVSYAKIDSTLRGSFGCLLDAAMDEEGYELSVVSSSFPQQGRITVGGYLLVHGIPLEKTDLAKDPVTPVNESNVKSLIEKQSKRNVANIGIESVIKGKDYLVNELLRLKEEGNEIIVADSTTMNDLATIANACMEVNALPCGSAGLAMALSSLLSKRGEVSVKVLCGSLQSIAKKQIEVAEKKLGIKAYEVNMNSKDEEIINNLNKILTKNKNVIIHFNPLKVSKDRADKVLSIVSKAILKNGVLSLVIIGGDTALSLMREAKVTALEVGKEIESGIPELKPLNGKILGTIIVSKAGGFGDEETLVRILNWVRERLQ
jgi:uncharacterized protein YgbK (DUF1537 family)